MRIAFVTFEYPPHIWGGAGIYAAQVTKELAKLGHQVVVFTPLIRDSEIPERVSDPDLRIWYVPVQEKIPFTQLQFCLRLRYEIRTAEKEQKFDIVHINGISYWFITRLSTAPHMLTAHHLVQDAAENTGLNLFSRLKDLSGENGFLLPFIEKRILNSVDRIIAVSTFTKDRILQTYHFPSSKVEVIYNGVDFDFPTFTSEELERTRQQMGLSDFPVVLFVGRLHDKRKGLDIMIQVFHQVLDHVDATLLVCGAGDPTRARNIAGAALSDNIVFAGYVDDRTLKKCYALCTVYVCPSRLEGFGLTILEALAAGKPVVAASVGAAPELIHDGSNGVLIEKGDLTGMTNAILQYLKDPEVGKQIRIPAAEYLREYFNWGTNVKALEQLYTIQKYKDMKK